MADHGVNTPGIGGYLLMTVVALVVSPLVLGSFFGIAGAESTDSVGTVIGTTLWMIVVVAIFQLVIAVPLALVSLPVVHLLCRRVRAQWVHVVVFGIVPLLAFMVWVGIEAGRDGWTWNGAGEAAFIGGVAAIGAMAGRAVMIPLVHRRRRDDAIVAAATAGAAGVSGPIPS
ncbi:MAG: hypothetical protein FWE71_08920 [Nocardioidaceae bacterium]|nr:hypothetical protein [Nocardioidaceae bacterium]MCL2612492.1 hypothetical protein [Nocardioidaceae bacterium]